MGGGRIYAMNENTLLAKTLTLDTIFARFATDEAARTFLETYLWPEGPKCPRCESTDPARVYVMSGDSARPGVRNCKNCRRQFTVTVGTIFEDSHIPLRKWVIAWYLINSSKKGISSLQLQRMLGLGSYRTALFMTHRIRHALKDTSFAAPLSGVVEMDETYVGGKGKPGTRKPGRPAAYGNKTPVVSLVERDGTKRSMVMERITSANLGAAIAANVSEGSAVMTDAYPAYRRAMKGVTHHSVNHSEGEYARRVSPEMVAHTNTVESSFSLLKRGVYGTFHSISKKHLHLYLAEFDHRWNTRKSTDGERTVAGIKKAKGKRLTYKAIKE
jgi:transposase-like protein